MALVGEMKNLTIGNKTYHIPIPTKTSDLQNDSNFMSGMTILSYGTSTWNDFLTAYKANHVVYCRASSNANPASGSQTRLAFMAYVSNADNPTNVEFQYYRSVSSHTASQQGDQVYVYKLDKTAGWTVTTREASVKVKIDTNNEGIKTTYSSGTVSIGHANSVTAQTTQAVYPIKIDAQGHISEYGSAVTIPTVDQTYDSTSANAQSGVAVASAIASLPEPMLFKGSLGTGGTITSLPTASSSNEGFVYKVIEDGTYASQAAKVGDTFISDGNNWVLIPSGDEPSGTVTSVGVANATNGGLSISGSPITSSGTITVGHSNVLSSAQTTSGVYPIKIDKNGHISEYGSAVSVPTQASDIGAQPTLVSGTNIKTINNNSILGSGNIDIQGAYIVTFTYDESEDVYTCDKTSQEIYEACISGENVVGVSYYGDPTSNGEFYDCKYVSKEVEGNINYYYAKFCSVEVEGGHAGSLILFVSNSGVRYESDFIYPITNIEGENWSNTITLDNGEGTASIQMNDRILDKTATIYWSTGDGANDSSTITLEAEKITLDADEILTSFNYTPTLANHFVNKGYVDTVIGNSLEIFLIEVSYDEDEEDYVSNKTFSQIQAAITANKTLLLHYVDEDRFYQCNAYSNHDINFYCLIGNTYYFIIIYNNNTIEIDDQSYNNDRLKWSLTTSSNTYYPLVGTTASDSAGLGNTLNGINFYQYYNTAGGYRRLSLGNSTSWKTTGGAYGTIRLYGAGSTYYGDLIPGTLGTTSGDGHISANRTWTLPDKTGTIALTSDVPDITGKQDILVSGTNIKTINNNSLLGSGDITIASSSKNIWYGTCASYASTENKVVTTSSQDFDFQAGSMLRVSFEDTNTVSSPYLVVDSGEPVLIEKLGLHQEVIATISRTVTSNSWQYYDFNFSSSALSPGSTFSVTVDLNSPYDSQDTYTDTVSYTAGQSGINRIFVYEGSYLEVQYNGSTTISIRSTYSWSVAFSGNVKTGSGTTESLANYWKSGAVLDFVFDGTNFVLSDGGTNIPKNTWYGICASSGSATAKTVSTSTGDYSLKIGNMIRVLFDNATSSTLTSLSIDGTAAIYVANLAGSADSSYRWSAGEVVDFVYDGTNYVMVEGGIASTTYYGVTKLSSSTSSTSTSLAATPSAVKAAYDLANSKVSDVQVNGTSVVSSGTASISTSSTPVANTIAKFDSSAHMNSADMTAQEIDDFVDSVPSAFDNLKNLNVLHDIVAGGDVIASGIPISQLHDWCLMYASSKTITNTEAQITGVTLWSGGTGSYFDTSTADQVKIKKAGRFLVIVNFRLSEITNANNVKRLGIWKNGASNQMAMGRLSSWEDSTSFDVKNYAVNDILKMYAKAEDNNSTLHIGSIFIIPIA